MNWQDLPLLKSSFFMNLNVQTIAHLLRSGNFWSESMMPVGLWDNSAIVATSNPQFVVPNIGIPCIIVRADEKDIAKLFREAFPTETKTDTPVMVTNEPIAAPVILPEVADLKIPDMPLPTEESPAVTAENAAAEEAAYAPIEVGSINLDFSNLDTTESTQPTVTATKSNIEPPPPPKEEEDVEEVTKRFSVAPSEANNVISMPTPAPVATTPAATDGSWNLQVFLKDFEKVMFLQWKGMYLEVTSWLGAWQINPSASKKIDVSSNSIFKIPLKSTYPYHGYVVGNPINDSFFQNFNGGRTPEHISVFPVYENEVFAGEIVCITTKAKGEKINLADFDPYLSKVSQAA